MRGVNGGSFTLVNEQKVVFFCIFPNAYGAFPGIGIFQSKLHFSILMSQHTTSVNYESTKRKKKINILLQT